MYYLIVHASTPTVLYCVMCIRVDDNNVDVDDNTHCTHSSFISYE